MPLAGTQNLLGSVRKAAEDVVRAKWKAIAAGRQITAADIDQMLLEMKIADSQAIIVHVIANAAVAVTGATGVIG